MRRTPLSAHLIRSPLRLPNPFLPVSPKQKTNAAPLRSLKENAYMGPFRSHIRHVTPPDCSSRALNFRWGLPIHRATEAFMKKNTKKSGKKKKPAPSSWPVTYRWVAMGTLVAYTALGASKVTLASPSGEHEKTGEGTSEQQALVVRRFDIPAGTLEEALGAFEKNSEIHVTFSEDGLKALLARPERFVLGGSSAQGASEGEWSELLLHVDGCGDHTL
jgi:hypothetical protein